MRKVFLLAISLCLTAVVSFASDGFVYPAQNAPNSCITELLADNGVAYYEGSEGEADYCGESEVEPFCIHFTYSCGATRVRCFPEGTPSHVIQADMDMMDFLVCLVPIQ